MSDQVRISSLEESVKNLSRILMKVQQYSISDPEVALGQARRAAEAILREIFVREIGEPTKILLDELLNRLVDKKVLPQRIVVPLRTIQAYGNYGVHAQSDMSAISSEYAMPCLAALGQVTSWYFAEYAKLDVPAELGLQSLVSPPPTLAAPTSSTECAVKDAADATDDEEQVNPEVAATPARPSKRKKAAPRVSRKPNAEFMRPVTPDSALAAIVGSNPMPRTEVMKKIWAYIKTNGLQDKRNLRQINADAQLRLVFDGAESLSMFEMTKVVFKHAT